MNLFEGKSPSERNKMIAAIVLGVLSLASLFLAFGPTIFGKKVTVSTQAPARPGPAPGATRDFEMPTQGQLEFDYTTTPIIYNGSNVYAPEPGRNIFAFYEPPPPTPYSPTPVPVVSVKPATPTPTPPMQINFVTPQSLYAGAGSFRLEVNGDKFEPSARIYFNQSEMPTTFINSQKLVTDVPASMISSDGPKQVIVQTPDGQLYSNQIIINVEAPPRPQFQYIGMVARKRANNDTAYFLEPGKQVPIGARLNDVVGGRFKVISISSSETILEDVNLGFKHRLALHRPAPGADTGRGTVRESRREEFPTDGGTYVPYNPNIQNAPQNIPGIPNNIPRYVPPQPPPRLPDKKDDVDDKDDDDPND